MQLASGMACIAGQCRARYDNNEAYCLRCSYCGMPDDVLSIPPPCSTPLQLCLQVISEEKQKLERQVDTLSSKLAQKEARMRNSVDALAKASYKLRASFTAEVRGSL